MKPKAWNILASAYACHPFAAEKSFPGEALLGWNLVEQISKFPETKRLIVLTRDFDRQILAKEVQLRQLYNVKLIFISLPKRFEVLLKNFFGFRLYYLLWQIQAFRVAKQIAKRVAIDLFHQINFSNDWMPSFIGAILPWPFIWGPIGGGQFTPISFAKEFSLRNRLLEKARVLFQAAWRLTWFRSRCTRRAKAILVCNNETRAKLPTDPERIFYFPVNGISENEINARAEHGKRKRLFKILYAGRLDPIKGIDLGIKAFNEFIKDNPDSEFRIIGHGPEEKRLKALAHRLNLDVRTKFIPWMSHADLLFEMMRSDVFLFPSIRDGGGAVVVEAMASGIPVICLNAGGPGAIVQKEWGIKIDPNNPQEVISGIAEALRFLYKNPHKREAMGKRGQEKAKEFYLWNEHGNRLHNIYKNVLKAN